VEPLSTNVTPVRLRSRPSKPWPVMVTWLPPSAGPEGGVTASTTGPWKTKLPAPAVASWASIVAPPGPPKAMSTVLSSVADPSAAAAASGEVTVISLSETTVGSIPVSAAEGLALPDGSKVTDDRVSEGSSKPVPVMVTVSPPSGRQRPGRPSSRRAPRRRTQCHRRRPER